MNSITRDFSGPPIEPPFVDVLRNAAMIRGTEAGHHVGEQVCCSPYLTGAQVVSALGLASMARAIEP